MGFKGKHSYLEISKKLFVFLNYCSRTEDSNPLSPKKLILEWTPKTLPKQPKVAEQKNMGLKNRQNLCVLPTQRYACNGKLGKRRFDKIWKQGGTFVRQRLQDLKDPG